MSYDGVTSSVSLLERDNLFLVRDCNIQQLAMKMYNVAHGLASKATSVLFLQYNYTQTCWQSFFITTSKYSTL